VAPRNSNEFGRGRREFPTVRAAEDGALAARLVATHALRGVSAGSALLRIGNRLLAVQDDAFCVAWIDDSTLEVHRVVLAGEGRPLPKLAKPDFESAVVTADGAVHLLGSGSTVNRCTVARFDPMTARASLREYSALYRCVRDALRLDGPANVEGAIVVARGARLRLFHRGSRGAPSATVDVPLAVLHGAPPHALAVQRFDLGALDGVPLAFTEAAVGGERRAVFVATAEDAPDAIADGPVSGSVIGVIEGKEGSVSARWTKLVGTDGTAYRRKVEGLALDGDLGGAWLLTDEDDPAEPAQLLRAELRGFRSAAV
jgi:hypothetical protein